MKRLLLAMFLLPSLALAAEEKKAAPAGDPMAGWVPRKVTNEAKDKKEITALFKKMEGAGKKGDLAAAVALVDFPVLMVTDDSKGEGMAEVWSREQWIEVMRPFYEKPMDMKVTHRPTIFLLSDSIASVDDVATITTGKKTVTTRNTTLLIRREGEWRVKAMAEPGWGDMMAESQGPGGGPQEPAEPAPPAAGAGAPEPAAPGTGEQPPPERTTK